MSLSKHLKEASLIVSLEQMEKTLNERNVLIEKGMSKFDADSEVKKSLVNKIYKNLFEELNDIKISANLPVETYKEKNILTIKKINTFYDKKIEDINKKDVEVVSEVEIVLEVEEKKEAVAEVEEKKEVVAEVEEKKEVVAEVEEKKEVVAEVEEKKEVVAEVEEKKEAVAEVEEKFEFDLDCEVVYIEEPKAARKANIIKNTVNRKVSKKNIIQIKKTLENLTRELINKKKREL
jgi:S-DNA-T family DNA segregation ATPase FtsK/SpoIIIE